VNKPRLLIGRSNADITIDDPTASRLHCALEVSERQVFVRDLGSSNGTFVNDQPVVIAPLDHGSTFRVGMHVFQLVITPRSA
jgi:pSer/pThr/pTyr-binding forkhead associated (FHA) protein